jgi:hypothetical protein
MHYVVRGWDGQICASWKQEWLAKHSVTYLSEKKDQFVGFSYRTYSFSDPELAELVQPPMMEKMDGEPSMPTLSSRTEGGYFILQALCHGEEYYKDSDGDRVWYEWFRGNIADGWQSCQSPAEMLYLVQDVAGEFGYPSARTVAQLYLDYIETYYPLLRPEETAEVDQLIEAIQCWLADSVSSATLLGMCDECDGKYTSQRWTRSRARAFSRLGRDVLTAADMLLEFVANHVTVRERRWRWRPSWSGFVSEDAFLNDESMFKGLERQAANAMRARVSDVLSYDGIGLWKDLESVKGLIVAKRKQGSGPRLHT